MIGFRSAGAMVAGLIGAVVGVVRDAFTPAPEPARTSRKLSEAERYSLRVRAAQGPAKQRLMRDRAYAKTRHARRATA